MSEKKQSPDHLEFRYEGKKTDIPGIIAAAENPVVFLGLDGNMMKHLANGGVLHWNSKVVTIIMTQMEDDQDYESMSRVWVSQLEKVERLKKLGEGEIEDGKED